jgi:hypothetical protein
MFNKKFTNISYLEPDETMLKLISIDVPRPYPIIKTKSMDRVYGLDLGYKTNNFRIREYVLLSLLKGIYRA